MRRPGSITAILALGLASSSPSWALQVFHTGNPGDVAVSTSAAFCLAGGGSDDGWVGGWRYLLERSGGGDVVILRADGWRGGYESWLYNDEENHGFPKVDSVTTLSLESADDANLPKVEAAIRSAELIFFAGGDQALYIDWFRGSGLAAAVEHAMSVRNVPVAGTSAGMALLAGIDYTGRYGPPADPEALVTSRDVLSDPVGAFVDLDRSVLVPPFLQSVVTETHFTEREREGRLVGFMARAVHNRYPGIDATEIKGIAADEGTAVCYDSTGEARVFGEGSAYFLRGNAPIERIESGFPLEWNGQGQAISAYVISGRNDSSSFDLNRWSGSGGRSEFWWVRDGALQRPAEPRD